MKRHPLDEIAPYPTSEEEVTAEAMIKHWLAFAQMHQHRLHHILATDDPRWMESIGHITSYYGMARLLRELVKHAGVDVADAAARELWLDWEAGDSVGEWTWEWLVEYGIDPEAVNRVTQEAHDRREAEERDKAGRRETPQS